MSPSLTSTRPSRSAAPAASANDCRPPFAMDPASSCRTPVAVRTETRQSIPSPQFGSASLTPPRTDTAPDTGLRHPTAIALVGDGWIATECGGRVNVVTEIGRSVAFALADGVPDGPGFRQPLKPLTPPTSRI